MSGPNSSKAAGVWNPPWTNAFPHNREIWKCLLVWCHVWQIGPPPWRKKPQPAVSAQYIHSTNASCGVLWTWPQFHTQTTFPPACREVLLSFLMVIHLSCLLTACTTGQNMYATNNYRAMLQQKNMLFRECAPDAFYSCLLSHFAYKWWDYFRLIFTESRSIWHACARHL